jgi:hypothetical protein
MDGRPRGAGVHNEAPEVDLAPEPIARIIECAAEYRTAIQGEEVDQDWTVKGFAIDRGQLIRLNLEAKTDFASCVNVSTWTSRPLYMFTSFFIWCGLHSSQPKRKTVGRERDIESRR